MKYLLLVVMLAPIGLLTYRGIVINKREYSKLTRDVVRLHIVAATSLLVYALTMLAANVFFCENSVWYLFVEHGFPAFVLLYLHPGLHAID